MSSTTTSQRGNSPTSSTDQQTIIVGLSGPSSSGKTTIARLLRTIFNLPSSSAGDVSSFIIHEDDFYKPDNQIPVTTTASGRLVQDWDTIGALNIPQLTSTLSYVCKHGALPPRLKSKEDLNEATDSGVDDATLNRIRVHVSQRLRDITQRIQLPQHGDAKYNDARGTSLILAFLEGFLLYAPPGCVSHVLRPVHEQIHVHLFLPATYTLLKQRREGRSGYVTAGPAPTPILKDEAGKSGDDTEDKGGEGSGDDEEFPEQNFWTDPPGYVDDIVWPGYIADHAWLLVPEDKHPKDKSELKEVVGEGGNVRGDMGVSVAPGKGEAPVVELLEWAVEEVLKNIEKAI